MAATRRGMLMPASPAAPVASSQQTQRPDARWVLLRVCLVLSSTCFYLCQAQANSLSETVASASLCSSLAAARHWHVPQPAPPPLLHVLQVARTLCLCPVDSGRCKAKGSCNLQNFSPMSPGSPGSICTNAGSATQAAAEPGQPVLHLLHGQLKMASLCLMTTLLKRPTTTAQVCSTTASHIWCNLSLALLGGGGSHWCSNCG